ncbi:tRNA adenosine(34) deaminase TadA [Salinisphaera sp. PC39]|uniref:tRNA adenosine(34) deaminase TadA n=1 Tax=Salinisphaera sp. PC39 TaxID=1304156 RepID=UPI003341643C
MPVSTSRSPSDSEWMSRALDLAARAESEGEVPVGALLVRDGELVAEGWNRPIGSHDATGHAEIEVLREAGRKLGNYRLPGTTLYVTLEPCVMCAGAIVHARVERLVYGAADPRTGAVVSVFNVLDEASLNHRVRYEGGVLAEESAELLRRFFRARRN